MLFSEFFILCLCCLCSYCLFIQVVMTMEQRHSVQHLSMSVDTGDGHAASKRVCNTLVFTLTGGNKILSFIKFFSKTLQIRLINIFCYLFSSVPVCHKILTKMPKCATSHHISFILICHYTSLCCSFMSSCYYLNIIM
jgi:hypothetical protein